MKRVSGTIVRSRGNICLRIKGGKKYLIPIGDVNALGLTTKINSRASAEIVDDSDVGCGKYDGYIKLHTLILIPKD